MSLGHTRCARSFDPDLAPELVVPPRPEFIKHTDKTLAEYRIFLKILAMVDHGGAQVRYWQDLFLIIAFAAFG